MVRQIRSRLRDIHSLRSALHLYLALKEQMQWAKPALEASLEQCYEKPDPWDYMTCPEEQDRFSSAIRLLDQARGGELFRNAFEVGCAEGVFTAKLAPLCKSLLAVDVSARALERARIRCAGTSVTFQRWDIMLSPVPSNMDLVVIMDVLELFFHPSDIRSARGKLISAIRPGGCLLLGNSRQDEFFETAPWGKWVLRGGKRIAECFGEDPRLTLAGSEAGQFYVNALFRVRA